MHQTLDMLHVKHLLKNYLFGNDVHMIILRFTNIFQDIFVIHTYVKDGSFQYHLE